MKGADREGLEALPAWFFAFGDGQAGDAVTLHVSVQAGAGQLRRRGCRAQKRDYQEFRVRADRLSLIRPSPG